MKIKKHERILNELIHKRELNDKYCHLNDCKPSQYMEGSNNIIDIMIQYIKNLK